MFEEMEFMVKFTDEQVKETSVKTLIETFLASKWDYDFTIFPVYKGVEAYVSIYRTR
jgi:hypothetical protein